MVLLDIEEETFLAYSFTGTIEETFLLENFIELSLVDSFIGYPRTMTPSTDYRKLSLLPDVGGVIRSQSDTSYEGLAAIFRDRRGRRSTDPDKKMVLRPLQLDDAPKECLLYRRLSKPAHVQEVTRSCSMRSVKKMAEARQRHRGSSIPTESNNKQYGGKAKERTVSNRSLPLPGDESEYLRLRNFSVTSKGVINRGDSFRSKCTKDAVEEEKRKVVEQPSPLREDSKVIGKKTYKVLLAGAPGVGKSSMWKQFMTSEYICADDFGNDREIDRVITVVLNSEESQMEFEEETLQEGNAFVLRHPAVECAAECDAYVIVYSVTDRRSYTQARHLLTQVERLIDTKAVILVGNKTDLARLRAVTTEEGRSLAKDRGCKFIETSVAINHQVDELLVGTLTQIRIKERVADKLKKKTGNSRRCSIYSGGCKASGMLKKILRRACLKSKSCDNLHVL